MKRPSSQTTLRARTLDDGTHRRGRRLLGKVVLVDAADEAFGIALAQRYAHEGADLALAYHTQTDALFAVQREIEALGNRCVLYEVDLDDEWNCRLVVQSTTECLGPVDLVVTRRGHVHGFDARAPLTPVELLTALHGPNRHYGVAHSAA